MYSDRMICGGRFKPSGEADNEQGTVSLADLKKECTSCSCREATCGEPTFPGCNSSPGDQL